MENFSNKCCKNTLFSSFYCSLLFPLFITVILFEIKEGLFVGKWDEMRPVISVINDYWGKPVFVLKA